MRLRLQRSKHDDAVCSFELRCVLDCSSAEHIGVQFYQAVQYLEPEQRAIVEKLLAGSFTELSNDFRVVEALEERVIAACTAFGAYLCRASNYNATAETIIPLVRLEGRTFLPSDSE